MPDFRLGDIIDDHCIKCRRVTNHAIVSLVNAEPAKVRCRTCYHDHDYRHEQAPPSKKDLKKAELFKEVLAAAAPGAPLAGEAAGRRAAEPIPIPPAKAAKKAAHARQKGVSGSPARAWDAARYQDQHSFVWRFGANLLELLEPQPGERILDLGCGTGQLTAEIARSGAHVVGLDNSADMLADARKNFPELEFVLADASSFDFPRTVRCRFLECRVALGKGRGWSGRVHRPRAAPGGRFVAEFGGKGNIASVQAALRAVLGPGADEQSPWYYPSIGEYSAVLERHGLEVRNASLFDRPTPLEGEDGLEHWLRMFGQTYLRRFSPDRADDIVRQLVEHLRPALYRDGVWTVDYRRLRVVAVRANLRSSAERLGARIDRSIGLAWRSRSCFFLADAVRRGARADASASNTLLSWSGDPAVDRAGRIAECQPALPRARAIAGCRPDAIRQDPKRPDAGRTGGLSRRSNCRRLSITGNISLDLAPNDAL